MPKTTDIDLHAAIVRTIRGTKFHFTTEADLQNGVAAALIAAGIVAIPEWRLTAADHLDFFVPLDPLGFDRLASGVAIETKISGSPSSVARQLLRYAKHSMVTSLIVVTARSRSVRIPSALNNKPVTVIDLWQGSLL